MRRLAVISLHTSPLVQPGMGDGGGMNVYVGSLASALARAGLHCDVYTRAWRPGLRPVQEVEPGFRVHHVAAGPARELGVEQVADVVDEFTAGVRVRMLSGPRPDLIHANYWLSGIAAHALKHDLSLPLVSTFHTLERVKAEATEHEQICKDRARAEAVVIGCSDTILASSAEEKSQLETLYAAEADRTEIVPLGVDHEMFAPGDRGAARDALDLGRAPVLLFAGRIQPLKGVDVAIGALALLGRDVRLLVVGGPSGRHGEAELRRLHRLVDEYDLGDRVTFIAPRPHASLATYYRAADACIVPSRSESFGLVALEAAACGTPVIAAAVGGLRTLVDHGRTGYLVDDRRPEPFAAYASLVLADRRLAAEMGAAATERSLRYSWSITAARLRRLYADLTVRELVECR